MMYIPTIEEIEEQMFQSLFSWNLLLMTIYLKLAGRTGYVSILVFVELALDDCYNVIRDI